MLQNLMKVHLSMEDERHRLRGKIHEAYGFNALEAFRFLDTDKDGALSIHDI